MFSQNLFGDSGRIHSCFQRHAYGGAAAYRLFCAYACAGNCRAAFGVAIIIFGLNSGAYVSEIMRSGINSVDRGQLEAGRAVGLSYSSSMLKIVILRR